ncbi:MAG: hypothetical protein KR126chlam6_00788 [Candidatus Anoxychlamydiales bacterium]|nr:hypothetical protein [Candidatus Anoxychlamydiales bacterium]
MATKTATSVAAAALQRRFEFSGEFRLPDQSLLERLKSLAYLDLETHGKIVVNFEAIKANATKTQKVQKLYQEALEFYKFGMFNLAFDVCKSAIDLKSEDQFTNSLLEKILVNIQNKKDKNDISELSGKEREFYDEIAKWEQEIRDIKKENESLSNEQKLKIYSRISSAFGNWGLFLKLDEKKYIKALEKYKKSLRADNICCELSPDEGNFYHKHKSEVFNAIGCAYLDLKIYKKALIFYEKAINLYEKNIEANKGKKDANIESQTKSLAKAYQNMAHVHKRLADKYKEEKEYEQALGEFETGLEMLKISRSIYDSNDCLEWLKFLYEHAQHTVSKILEANKGKK